MGILSDSTPAIFEVDGKEIKAQVLTLKQMVIEVKAGLRAAGEKLQGAALDDEAENRINAFNFPPQAVELLLYQACKITKGFTKEDAAELTKASLRLKAYEIFTYAVMGVPPEVDAKKKKVQKKKKARAKRQAQR